MSCYRAGLAVAILVVAALALPKKCLQRASSCLPACLQQHQKHNGLGIPPAVEKNPATILSAFCQVLTSWSRGSGIKCSACSHRLCPAKEKCFLCQEEPAGFCKTIALWGKRISFHSKTQPWGVGSCPKQKLAGMGVGATGTGVAARRL